MAAKKSNSNSAASAPSSPSSSSSPSVPSAPSAPSASSAPSSPSSPSFAAVAHALRSLTVGAPGGSGDAVLAVARAHVGEKYVLGQRVPMIDETWRGPWDCAEFASWSVYQATGTLYGTRPIDDPIRADAYTGYWGEQARADGAVVSVELAARTPGALVLRLPVGDRGGHIVISDGLGGTIEAHSAARGVVADTVQKRRWDFGILVPGLQYFSNDEPVAVQPAPDSILRVTNPMMRGARVRAVQLALTKLGFAPGPVDGIYGPQVASAVQDFQASRQLVPDGEVGPTTRRALGIR